MKQQVEKLAKKQVGKIERMKRLHDDQKDKQKKIEQKRNDIEGIFNKASDLLLV